MDKKKLVIGLLCTLIMIMAVGYALLSQQLQITGQANITSNWQVEITNIKEVENIGSGRTISTNYTATTATFNNEVIHTGDKITYEITVTNKGTLDAVLEGLTINKGNNEAILVSIDKTIEYYKEIKLPKNGGINTIMLTIEYDSSTTSQPSSNSNTVNVNLNYEQLAGQQIRYKSYSLGDTVNFDGSNWHVMQNSPETQDYITIIKDKILTNTELGDYASSSSANTMEFTWNETCHNQNHGYSSSLNSDCNNTNDYENSKVKEFLEGTYLNSLGSSNLKEVDGKKIRLITESEIQAIGMDKNWISSQTFFSIGTIFYYWTMTPDTNSNSVKTVYSNSSICDWDCRNYINSTTTLSQLSAVRPVINLLKSSI